MKRHNPNLSPRQSRSIVRGPARLPKPHAPISAYWQTMTKSHETTCWGRVKYYVVDVSKDAKKPCFEIRYADDHSLVCWSVSYEEARKYAEGTLQGTVVSIWKDQSHELNHKYIAKPEPESIDSEWVVLTAVLATLAIRSRTVPLSAITRSSARVATRPLAWTGSSLSTPSPAVPRSAGALCAAPCRRVEP